MTTDELHGVGDYTASMLQIAISPHNGYPRLLLQGVQAPAWIDRRSWHLRGVDWQLWVERKGRMTSAKCPIRLEIESLLRSWLLQVCGMPLHALTYTQLRLITEGNIAQVKRLHVRGHDTLMHRLRVEGSQTLPVQPKRPATSAPAPVVGRDPPLGARPD